MPTRGCAPHLGGVCGDRVRRTVPTSFDSPPRGRALPTIQPEDMTSRAAVRSPPAPPPPTLLRTLALCAAGGSAQSCAFRPHHAAQPMPCPTSYADQDGQPLKPCMNGQTSVQSCLSVIFRMLRSQNRINGVIAAEPSTFGGEQVRAISQPSPPRDTSLRRQACSALESSAGPVATALGGGGCPVRERRSGAHGETLEAADSTNLNCSPFQTCEACRRVRRRRATATGCNDASTLRKRGAAYAAPVPRPTAAALWEASLRIWQAHDAHHLHSSHGGKRGVGRCDRCIERGGSRYREAVRQRHVGAATAIMPRP